jgi:Recombination endonuclease VII
VPDQECTICGTSFTARRRTDKTCSLDCQIQHRRTLTRERARKHYKPRPPRPDTTCESCPNRVVAPKSGKMPRWCADCRARRQVERGQKRLAVRRCYKCKEPVPEAARKPGHAVCGNCRGERRKDEQIRERRRTLRKYGLTQEQFDELLAAQDGRCAGCGTDEPGAKGWNIDHCHTYGHVRALLCLPCNTIIGLADEDPAKLRGLAFWLEQQTAQVINRVARMYDAVERQTA